MGSEQFSLLASDVREIKEALLGTFESPGIAERLRKVEEKVKTLRNAPTVLELISRLFRR
jgi:hypothetical protein